MATRLDRALAERERFAARADGFERELEALRRTSGDHVRRALGAEAREDALKRRVSALESERADAERQARAERESAQEAARAAEAAHARILAEHRAEAKHEKALLIQDWDADTERYETEVKDAAALWTDAFCAEVESGRAREHALRWAAAWWTLAGAAASVVVVSFAA